MTTIKNAGTTTVATVLFAMPALAHHSFAAAYNLQNPIEIKGSIVDVRLTNPHSHFFVDIVNAKGETEHWKIEAGTPSGMIRNGYSPKIIKKGDIVTIKGFRARDDSTNGMLRELVTSDGTVYGMFGPQEGGAGGTR